MKILVSVLIICLLMAVGKILIDRKRMKQISFQLKLVKVNQSQANVPIQGYDKAQNELITEINQLIEKLKSKENEFHRLSQQNKLMISSISHDFRTPLTSIMGYIQILQEKIDSENEKRYLKIVEERAINLNRLIEDFYTLSIIDSEEFPLEIKKVNPKVILQNQIALYYEELSKTFPTIIVEMDEKPLFLFSSERALTRIFANLLKNAFLYGTDSLRIRTEQASGSYTLILENKVTEASSIDIEKLFERTYSGNGVRNTNSTGLGLSIAEKLAIQIHCQLSAKQQGEWLQFSLQFRIK